MVLEKLFSTRAVSGHANPQKWFVEWTHGDNISNAGISVTPEAAAAFSTYFACVRTIAETMASLPFFTYKHLKPRGKERAGKHPVNRLIHDEPNRDVTAAQFWETLFGHEASWGNGYAQIVRDGSGRPVELWNLNPNEVTPQRRPQAPYELFYRVTDGRGNVYELEPSQVLHIASFGWDGIQGKSPAALHKDTIGLGLAAVSHNAKFFKNGALPRGVLMSPTRIKGGTKQIRDDWRKIYQSGDDNIAVLHGDVKYQPITMSAADAQLILLLKWTVAEVARSFRMPLHKIQDYERATYSNVEHLAIEFVQDVVLPRAKKAGQECNRKLLLESERNTYFCEFVIEGLLRGDFATRIAGYKEAILNGWMSPDDVRELENMNPLPDGIGEIYVMQGQMTPLERLAEEPEPEPEPVISPTEPEAEPDEEEEEEDGRMALLADSYRGLFEDAFRRIFTLEIGKVGQAAKREPDLASWVTRFFSSEEHKAHICAAIGTAIDACGGAIYSLRTGKPLDDNIHARLLGHSRTLALRHVQLSQAAVEQAISTTNPTEGLRALFERWKDRPAAMAKQEVDILQAAVTEWHSCKS